MRRFLFLLSALAFALSVSAQTPEAIREIIRKNRAQILPTLPNE